MVNPKLEEAIKKFNPRYIIGADEVAWGACAYNLTLGCAVYEPDFTHEKIKDSKKYTTEKSRQKAFDIVSNTALWVSYQEADPDYLVKIGAGAAIQAQYLILLQRAILRYPNSLIVIDGNHLIKGLSHPQIALPKADAFVPAVSAASIAAKVTRDNQITILSQSYPEYLWHKNKGYPTQQHLEAIRQHGVSKHHRMNVDFMADFLKKYGRYEDKH